MKHALAAPALLAVICISLPLLSGTGGSPAAAAEITVGLAAAASSADPYYHRVGPNDTLASMLFDPLVQTDGTGRLHPALATKWELLDDHTWRFTLAPDARFHDGTPVTANDVLYSLCRPLGAISPTASYTNVPKSLAAAEAPDPHTVVLKTRDPFPTLLYELATYAIISANSGGAGAVRFDVADRCGMASVPQPSTFDGGKMANGSGRYWLEHYTPGDVVVLRANPDHVGAKPRWDRVTLKPVPNTGARDAGLLAGDYDLIVDPAAQDIPRIRTHGGFAITSTPSERVMFLQPDIGRAKSPQVTTPDGRNPLQDERVRRAISLAIDRHAIVDRIMGGMAVAAEQYAPPGMPGALADPPKRPYDPAQAKKLLAEAGWPDGFGLAIAATNDRYINDAQVAQAIAQYLSRVGLHMTVDTMPQTVFFPGRPKRLFSLALGGWGQDESSSILRVWLATTDMVHAIGTSNYGGYSNPAFDAAFAVANTAMDETRRLHAIEDATRIALEDDALIPLYYETSVWAYKDKYTYTGRVDQMTDVDDLAPKP